MSRFDDCLPVILGNEGGYSNNAADRGGATNFGVTQSTYDSYRISNGLPQQPVSVITQADVAAIYRAGYWDAVKCDSLPLPVDMMTFDAAVNSGPRNAARFLQRAAGVTDDGIIGPGTLGAVASTNAQDLARACLNEREDFLHAVVGNDPTQARFLAGWINRINKLRSMI